MKQIETWVEEQENGKRLDAWMAEKYKDTEVSRGDIQELIQNGFVTVNDKKVKSSYKIHAGEKIVFQEPVPKTLELIPQNIPLPIIYEDEDVVVLDKPKGMVVHPAHGNWDGTLVNALLYHVNHLSSVNGEFRPGIVHRLDKDTSGVMMAAKNNAAHENLAEQIRVHSIKREYIALVHGTIHENLGTIDAPIGRSKRERQKMAVIADGRPAVSDYEVLERFRNYTLVKVQLHTGRTHQIRVHFSYIKHSVVGDPLYGSGKKHFGVDSQMLHACTLGFVHPSSGEYMEFHSSLPEYFQNILEQLRSQER